mmetsp:Transcript_30356/g.42622  ORF Transcript_30356/g.42622 Transcript_30356/m.42622 type:complete len:187 (-) Transcript_30356:38-598(-)
MRYKIVMLGEGGVGKSCLTIQFCHGYFTLDYDPTIENLYRKQVTIDEEACLLEIVDTAGQEDYVAMRDQNIVQGEGFVLVYSIIHEWSFQQLGELYQSIMRVKDKEDYPIVVFGNKADLEPQRCVTTAQGKEFAQKINAPFFETSAKTKLNIEAGFCQLVREMRKWAKKQNDEQKGNKTKKKCIIV